MLPLKTYPEGVGEGKIPFKDAAQAESDSRVSLGLTGVETTQNGKAMAKKKLERGDIVRWEANIVCVFIHEERSGDGLQLLYLSY
jgi:hypothetical protein